MQGHHTATAGMSPLYHCPVRGSAAALWDCSAGQENDLRGPQTSLRGAYTKAGEGFSTKARRHRVRGNDFKLKEGLDQILGRNSSL